MFSKSQALCGADAPNPYDQYSLFHQLIFHMEYYRSLYKVCNDHASSTDGYKPKEREYGTKEK